MNKTEKPAQNALAPRYVGKYVFESIVHWFVSFIRLIGVSETNESNRKWGVERAYFQDRHGSHHLHRVGIFAQSSEKSRIFDRKIHTIDMLLLLFLDRIQHVAWKQPKLRIVRIESYQNLSCQNWKLLKLKVAIIEKLPKLKVANFQDRHGSHHLHRIGIFAQPSEKTRNFDGKIQTIDMLLLLFLDRYWK